MPDDELTELEKAAHQVANDDQMQAAQKALVSRLAEFNTQLQKLGVDNYSALELSKLYLSILLGKR